MNHRKDDDFTGTGCWVIMVIIVATIVILGPEGLVALFG